MASASASKDIRVRFLLSGIFLMSTVETKIAILETTNNHFIETLIRIEKKLEGLDARMWAIMIGLVAYFGMTLVGIVAKEFKMF